MKRVAFLFNVLIASLAFCLLPGCVTMYKPFSLEKLPLDDDRHTIECSDIQISISYDVLTGPGTKQYAKMEKKNKVSLVILTIHNSGQHELLVDRDLMFLTSAGDSIVPLALEPALESLVKPVTDEENMAFFQVEPPSGWITDVGRLVNDSKKVVSHIRFTKDMLEYYLEGRVVAPGSHELGLIVFPVAKGTPLQIAVR
jgi:hypothetical protein